MSDTTHTAAEFNAALARLDLTQAGLARAMRAFTRQS
jgi:hypothetical protein